MGLFFLSLLSSLTLHFLPQTLVLLNSKKLSGMTESWDDIHGSQGTGRDTGKRIRLGRAYTPFVCQVHSHVMSVYCVQSD